MIGSGITFKNGGWVCAALAGFLFFSIAVLVKTPAHAGQARLEISVSGDRIWTDTGMDVSEGQEIYFRAAGHISLQKGNPVTYCGPEGYSYRSLQQPLQDQNIGSLIGKVYFLVSVEVDKEKGEEVRNDREEIFYIGPSSRIIMPMAGRLFLGINENLVVDNEGIFTVAIYSITERF